MLHCAALVTSFYLAMLVLPAAIVALAGVLAALAGRGRLPGRS
ncbi:MAG TPA: hypothetical protein VLF66_00155 [Thermoanaerobaculia bacterium]|nr:hypothetical protein [Thermoanaerobaculia bacterium]